MRAATALAAVAVAIVAAGCGEQEEQDPAPEPRPAEKAQRVPHLPAGWTELDNAAQGFALGVPPGWRDGGDCFEGGGDPGPGTTICSPDRLATVGISADRTGEALELDPAEFATRAADGLGEETYRNLRAGKPRPFAGLYDGASVAGTAVTKAGGVRQDFVVVALRRDRVATFTALIAVNADRGTPSHLRYAERAVRTLRSSPVGAG